MPRNTPDWFEDVLDREDITPEQYYAQFATKDAKGFWTFYWTHDETLPLTMKEAEQELAEAKAELEEIMWEERAREAIPTPTAQASRFQSHGREVMRWRDPTSGRFVMGFH